MCEKWVILTNALLMFSEWSVKGLKLIIVMAVWPRSTGIILASVNKSIPYVASLSPTLSLYSSFSSHRNPIYHFLYSLKYVITFFISLSFSCFPSSMLHLFFFPLFPFSFLLQKILDGNSRVLKSNPGFTIRANCVILSVSVYRKEGADKL